MDVVMNEYEWAEDAIRSGDIGLHPFTTLRRVAGYYYENKYSKKEVRDLVERFLIRCDPTANISKWSDTLDRISKNVDKRKLSVVDSITVTKQELEKIESLRFKNKRRLAFTLLCLAKFGDASFEHNNHWVKYSDSEITGMANIHATSKTLNMMIGELIDLGFLKRSWRVDNTSLQVLFIEDGDPEMVISDLRNLGNRYLMYYGEPYFECTNCGLVVKSNTNKKQSRVNGAGRKQMYCSSCADIIHTKQKVESVMRIRKDNNTASS